MVVCDAITLEAIPYATVKVLHKEDGTYADEVGKFEVKVYDKDSLMVSCVGYQPSYKPYSGDCIGFGLTFDKNQSSTYSRTLIETDFC